MKQKSIISMLLAVMLLCSCTTVRTYNVQGTPGCKVSLQSVDNLSETTLDASGQGKIQWTAEKSGNTTPLPTYLYSTNQSSLVIPIGMDYKDGHKNLAIGSAELSGGIGMEVGGILAIISGSPVGIPLMLCSVGCYADGIRRMCSVASDFQTNIEFLPFHTNDDMTFSMTPSRPSGEPKLRRTAETKQAKGQTKTKTASKKTSSKQESKAKEDAFYHTVEQGEKLADIAKNYGVTMAEIIRANKLKSNNIKPGQKLIIPM